MEIKSVFNDLDTFYKAYSRQYKFMNPRYAKTYNSLSWENHISNEKFDSYEEYYQWVIDKIQYSLLLGDESAVQIYFEGERKGKKYEIKKGSMAYLPNPKKYSEYFRFDLDYKNSEHYNHTAYHIHFGYKAKDVRFSLLSMPLPSEFIKFILFLDYNVEYEYFNDKNFLPDLDKLDNKYNHILQLIKR